MEASIAIRFLTLDFSNQLIKEQLRDVCNLVFPRYIKIFETWSVFTIETERNRLKKGLRNESDIAKSFNSKERELVSLYLEKQQFIETEKIKDMQRLEQYLDMLSQYSMHALLVDWYEEKALTNKNHFPSMRLNIDHAMDYFCSNIKHIVALQEFLFSFMDKEDFANGNPTLKGVALSEFITAEINTRFLNSGELDQEGQISFYYVPKNLKEYLALDLANYFSNKPNQVIHCNFCKNVIYDVTARQISNFNIGLGALHDYCRVPHRRAKQRINKALKYKVKSLMEIEDVFERKKMLLDLVGDYNLEEEKLNELLKEIQK